MSYSTRSDYAGDLMKMINIRGGGLAIHGGLILGTLTVVVLCHVWKIDTLELLDLIAPGVAVAQAICAGGGNYFQLRGAWRSRQICHGA